MEQQQYREHSGAYRAYHRKALAIGFHSAGVKLPSVAKPAGFDFPSADPLTFAAGNRTKLIAKLREDRAELARRDAERAEYAALQLDAPRYIRTDALIRAGMEAAVAQHLAHVRGAYLPLTVLTQTEGWVELGLILRAAA